MSARDIALCARQELAEAVRSRLLIVVVMLFVGGGAVAAWGYTELLERVESNAARVTGGPAPRQPGGLVRRLRSSRSYRDMLRTFTGSDAKADYYAAIPPMVVFFGWASFAFTPWLVLFLSAETVAGDVASRGIRFTALRTGRLDLALGKMAGQGLIVVAVTAAAAAAFYLLAWARLDGFEHGATIAGLASLWPRVMVYLLPFLGWAMLASMVTASRNLARILSLAGGVALSILGGVATARAVLDVPMAPVWDLLRYVTPFPHKEGLWYPPGGALVADVAVCLSLTAVYFAAGYARLRGRDL